jgi:hypothetical protein
MVVDPALLDWLLDADPALRWQGERDVAGAPQEVCRTWKLWGSRWYVGRSCRRSQSSQDFNFAAV